MKSKGFGKKALDLLFPPRCQGCGKLIDRDDGLCGACLAKYGDEQRESCPVCGRTARECSCGAAALGSSFIGNRRYCALTFYNEYNADSERITEKLIFRLKRKNSSSLTDFFAREAAAEIMRLMQLSEERPEEWIITWPPRTPRAVLEYGYDQSEAVARRISYYTGIPWKKMLVRTGGREQKGLGAEEREANASTLALLRRKEAEVKRFILFDDVITTGATVREAAEQLYGAGAEAVFPVCIAKTLLKEKTDDEGVFV